MCVLMMLMMLIGQLVCVDGVDRDVVNAKLHTVDGVDNMICS